MGPSSPPSVEEGTRAGALSFRLGTGVQTLELSKRVLSLPSRDLGASSLCLLAPRGAAEGAAAATATAPSSLFSQNMLPSAAPHLAATPSTRPNISKCAPATALSHAAYAPQISAKYAACAAWKTGA